MHNVARRRRHQSARSGQVMIAFALMFLFFLFGAIGGVLDLGVLYANQSTIAKAAQDGAIAGAAAVDLPNFRTTGNVRLIPANAVTACQNAIIADLGALPPGTTCTTPGGGPPVVAWAVTVKISKTIANLPVKIGLGNPTVSAQYTAFAQCGTWSPDSACN